MFMYVYMCACVSINMYCILSSNLARKTISREWEKRQRKRFVNGNYEGRVEGDRAWQLMRAPRHAKCLPCPWIALYPPHHLSSPAPFSISLSSVPFVILSICYKSTTSDFGMSSLCLVFFCEQAQSSNKQQRSTRCPMAQGPLEGVVREGGGALQFESQIRW